MEVELIQLVLLLSSIGLTAGFVLSAFKGELNLAYGIFSIPVVALYTYLYFIYPHQEIVESEYNKAEKTNFYNHYELAKQELKKATEKWKKFVIGFVAFIVLFGLIALGIRSHK